MVFRLMISNIYLRIPWWMKNRVKLMKFNRTTQVLKKRLLKSLDKLGNKYNNKLNKKKKKKDKKKEKFKKKMKKN